MPQQQALDRHATLALLLAILFAALTAGGGGCAKPKPPAPLGPEAVTFYGSTKFQCEFDPLAKTVCLLDVRPPRDPNRPPERGPSAGGADKPARPVVAAAQDPPLDVLCLLVDTNDHRFTGADAQRTAYRNAKFNLWQPFTNSFWTEASYGNVSINMNMPDRLLHMGRAFDDYFNRDYVPASLTTSGLSGGGGFPKAFPPGASFTLHVRDSFDRDWNVPIALPANVATPMQLATVCQVAINAVPGTNANWVTCTVAPGGAELRFELTELLVDEGSFIRPAGGNALPLVGLNGPVEAPGDNVSPASLTGKPIIAPFPLTLAAGASIQLEVRDKDLVTRQYTIPLPPGTTLNTIDDLADNFVLPKVNTEFPWVEKLAGGGGGGSQLGLRVVTTRTGRNAAVRVINGTNLASLGLDGPTRVDGPVSKKDRNTFRGEWRNVTAEALSAYVKARAGEMGLAINAGNKAALDGIVNGELKGWDSYMVVFADDLIPGMPGGKRGGASGGNFDIRVPGDGGFVYTNQLNASLVLGQGTSVPETYAHEFGHNLGCWDLYLKPHYDKKFDPINSYLNAWSIMSRSARGNHPDGWHKDRLGHIPGGDVRDVFSPPSGVTEHHKFTLIPLEYGQMDYSDFGNSEFPQAQFIRVHLAEAHYIGVENRQPGKKHSKTLPDDVNGQSPAAAPGRPGGVLVTDTVDPWDAVQRIELPYRSAVTSKNPPGTGGPDGQSRGMKAGDNQPMVATFPKYDGISVNVLEEVPGPVGLPPVYKVDVVWGPGDFLDLVIRPWQAPNAYGTPDIWLDWPGNGEENFPTSDPPVGAGDQVHWDPGGQVVNFIKVRVHNNGTVLGKQVVVKALVNDPIGMGDKGTFVPLKESDPQDIPPKQFRDFKFEWKPKSKGHTCIRAEIVRHESDFGDLDPRSDVAQENVDDFFPEAGSPYAPVDFAFSLKNDFPFPVEVDLQPSGLVDGMDLELEKAYLKMLPEQAVTLKGRLLLDTAKITPDFRERKRDYCFNLHAFKRTEDSVLPFGGISVAVHPGFKADLALGSIRRDREKQSNDVVVTGTLKGKFPANQRVDVALVASDGRSYGGTGMTDASGNFRAAIGNAPEGKGRVMLYYFGTQMAAATAGPIKVDVPERLPL